ncbi:hypothetical protein [Sinorhizobium meliloti]|uniref:hypothetical protein n=1 Tax=Rhizobium meliloti TaxID=382 RepID=UPI000FD7F24B|nr:hypothetical protein [Sinorhizobium meliloti]RVH21468.1 hypothetical protein CN216_00410 [Sinorhizobium meliloti]RVH21529.1 hypothetical protein CN216_00730 [Sinorhizobium meliloti]
MSPCKHTPGPWVVDYDETITNTDEFYSVKANGRYIVSLFKSGTSAEDEHSPEAESEVRANADLIAAAPDMLEALKGILSNPGGRCSAEQWQAGLRAISKAEGRS